MSENCDDISYTKAESKVHIHTCHEVITRQSKEKGKTVMLILLKRTVPEKLLQTSSILLKFGGMVDVAFDDIDES